MNKHTRLIQNEWNYLSNHFGLSEQAATSRIHSVRILDLLDSEICSDYLDRLTIHLQSPSRMITASQFLKRYAYLTSVPLLYAMSVYNKGLDLSVENCTLESSDHFWLEHVGLADVDATMPATNERHVWRDTVIQAFFAGNIGKLIQVMSKVANVPKAILWENVAVRVFSLYEKRIGVTEDPREHGWGQADFKYLIYEAPGALFGERKNPLSRFYGEHTSSTVPNAPMRIRKTCCFYYEVSCVEEYCSNCPKVRS